MSSSFSNGPRRTIGFIGNCQTELLHRAFASIVPADQVRSFYHFFDIADDAREQARAELALCDDLLVQDIKNFEGYGLRNEILPRTNIILFPFLYFAALWPYDDFNGLRDNHARAQDDPALHTVIYYDGVLGKLRKLGGDADARITAYRALDVKGLVAPERILDFEMRRLEGMDARFKMDIGAFILAEFRQQKLFYTVNRPCGLLLEKLLAFIIDALKLDLVLPAMPQLDELGATEVPVHPKIAEQLGMTWLDEKAEARWEAHMRAYIARYS